MVRFPVLSISKTLFYLNAFLVISMAQQAGHRVPEDHPELSWQMCMADGSCTIQPGAVTLDANWRWVHSVQDLTSCYSGNTWNSEICPDDQSCTENCALEGADYASTYGITTSRGSLRQTFRTHGAQQKPGSRLFLMADDEHYQIFYLLNQELSFDVDVFHPPCGLNGAIYLAAMDKDGGMGRSSSNGAGAKYGTGYCSSQCPRDLKFINGLGNVEGWTPLENDMHSATGGHGSCCAGVHLWRLMEGRLSIQSILATPLGRLFALARAVAGSRGNELFFGPGLTVDTKLPMTVVTQFITHNHTALGHLTEVKRFYVQNGKVIPNSESTIPGVSGNSINKAYCAAQKQDFDSWNSFSDDGGQICL